MIKPHKKYILIAALFLLLSAALICKTATEFGSRDAAKKILIINSNSNFKQKVITGLFEKSSSQTHYYKVVDISKAKEVNLQEFDRYIVLCKQVGGRVEKKSNSFVQGIQDKSKVLIVMTHGLKNPLPENAQKEIGSIDVITSASETGKIEKVSTEIYDWVNAE